MRSFDWFLKMLKFDKNVKKTSDKKNVLVLRSVELMTLGLHVKIFTTEPCVWLVIYAP